MRTNLPHLVRALSRNAFALASARRASSWMHHAVIATVLIAALTGCDLNNPPQPQGGGYTERKPDEPGTPQPEAKSVLGRAKQSAERVINEDIAEYNRKLEEAADGKYE